MKGFFMCDSCDFIMPHGKHRGETLDEIYSYEKSYLDYIYNDFSPGKIHSAVEEYLEEHD